MNIILVALAERAAWAWMRTHTPTHFTLTTICPSLVVGPMLSPSPTHSVHVSVDTRLHFTNADHEKHAHRISTCGEYVLGWAVKQFTCYLQQCYPKTRNPRSGDGVQKSITFGENGFFGKLN